jgi:4-hydroxybenzoate polyprenyltransferase
LLGFAFLLFLPPLSILFSVSIVVTGVIYSFFRLKKYFLVKNFYTGFVVSQLLLLGAANISNEAILYYFIFSVFFFIGSLISDLRDYDGDKTIDIKTLPVHLGYNLTRKITYFLLIGLSVLILGSSLYSLFPVFTFILIIFFFLIRDNPKMAHFSEGISLISLVVWLYWFKLLGY